MFLYQVMAFLMTLLGERLINNNSLTISLERGVLYTDGMVVKGYQQEGKIVIFVNMHTSIEDAVATFVHELAHFMTPPMHDEHGFMFLSICSALMALVEKEVYSNIHFCASETGTNLVQISDKMDDVKPLVKSNKSRHSNECNKVPQKKAKLM